MATTRPVAIVTGASSGVGRETARALAAAGFEVIGTARNAA
ncbi:SDR family NAD(P)-dependent oxidoreductase, partial [Streptomyces sp. NPDC050619]